MAGDRERSFSEVDQWDDAAEALEPYAAEVVATLCGAPGASALRLGFDDDGDSDDGGKRGGSPVLATLVNPLECAAECSAAECSAAECRLVEPHAEFIPRRAYERTGSLVAVESALAKLLGPEHHVPKLRRCGTNLQDTLARLSSTNPACQCCYQL